MTAEDITGEWQVPRPYLVLANPKPGLSEADVERILERLAVMSAKLDALEVHMQTVQALAQSNAEARIQQDAKVAAFWENGPGRQWPEQLADHESRLRVIEKQLSIVDGYDEGERDGAQRAHDRWLRAIQILKTLGIASVGAGGIELLRALAGG